MTYPGARGQQWGGSEPPFERAGQQVIGSMRQAMSGPPPRHPMMLTPEDRAEAQKAAEENRHCAYCGGIHVAPSTLACPRLSGGKLDGDGKIVEFSFWPGRDWAEGRVVFVEDALENAESGEDAGDGG